MTSAVNVNVVAVVCCMLCVDAKYIAAAFAEAMKPAMVSSTPALQGNERTMTHDALM